MMTPERLAELRAWASGLEHTLLRHGEDESVIARRVVELVAEVERLQALVGTSGKPTQPAD